MGDEGLKHRERAACTPEPVAAAGFNLGADLPYGLTIEHVRLAMNDFTDFLGFVNQQLFTRDMERLESIVMPANFSSIVGEFMSSRIPKHCPSTFPVRDGVGGATAGGGLAFRRQVGDEPEDDHGERHPHGLREDDGELDLQGGYSDRS